MGYDGATWNEASPVDSDLASNIDDIVRDVKIAVRSRLAHEHVWSASQTATGSDGQHSFITLTTQTSAPGLVYGTSTQAGAVYAKATGTGVSLVAMNSAGYDFTLSHSAYTGGGVVPKGGIIMWSGTVATIPFGWALCDGNNGTPDLRDKFIVGAKQDDAGTAKTNVTGSLLATGGSIDISHLHDAGTLLGNATNWPAGSGTPFGGGTSPHTHTVTGQTATGGSTTSVPPFYALAFIQKL